MSKFLWGLLGIGIIMITGCASILDGADARLSQAVRLVLSPARILINEGRDLFRDEDFRLSHGDMVMEYPDQSLNEYTVTMSVVGVDAVGRLVTMSTTAGVRNPDHLSKLGQASCPPQTSCASTPAGGTPTSLTESPPSVPTPIPLTEAPLSVPTPTGSPVRDAQQVCRANHKVITLTMWLRAISRTGFDTCQAFVDEETGQPFVVPVVFAEPKCAITIEPEIADGTAWTHLALSDQGYTVIALYPDVFLNTIAGAQRSALGQIDACVYDIPE